MHAANSHFENGCKRQLSTGVLECSTGQLFTR